MIIALKFMLLLSLQRPCPISICCCPCNTNNRTTNESDGGWDGPGLPALSVSLTEAAHHCVRGRGGGLGGKRMDATQSGRI
jgi:hypothetical protein